MGTSGDRRVRKSEAAMRGALVALMEEKSLAQVTVREVADLADVNRSTFYRHYLDVPDMAEKMGSEIVAGMLEIMLEYKEDVPHGVPAECISRLAAYLKGNRRMFLAFDGEGGDIRFSRSVDAMFRDYARRYLWPTFGEGADDARPPLLFSFYFSGLSSLMREWLSSGCKQSERYLGQIAECLDKHAQCAFVQVGRDDG